MQKNNELKNQIINDYIEYLKENNVYITLFDFIHDVLNYSSEESRKILNIVFGLA